MEARNLILSAFTTVAAAMVLVQALAAAAPDLKDAAVNLQSTVEASNSFRQSQLSLLNLDPEKVYSNKMTEKYTKDNFNDEKESYISDSENYIIETAEVIKSEINTDQNVTDEDLLNEAEKLADKSEESIITSKAKKIFNSFWL